MRRFYAHPRQFHQDQVTLEPEETFHLARVLRLSVGARVEVCDGQGGNFAARVATLDPRGATLRILGKLDSWGESPLPLVLGIGLAKGEAMDEAVRQATEMGVSQIFPFISERSERLTPERVERRRERWRRLARESIKSCQRSMLPLIEPPRDFAAALKGPEEVKLIFWEEGRGGGLHSLLQRSRPRDVRVLIGSEGGFSSAEAALAREAGFHVVSLGPRRLKVATATLAAITLVQYAWGDLA
ncbi:MAG: 16S rRNA (uracil(1498)-N(3))-methyltransferase [Deltaproteobacteria bacterium]|nr:16S rRNA (uracil(1498)-N(3))-methyltransferase [Deltaproteobacteria bacterium]